VSAALSSSEKHGRVAGDSAAASGDRERDRTSEDAGPRRPRPSPVPPEAPLEVVAPQRLRYGHPHPEIFLG